MRKYRSRQKKKHKHGKKNAKNYIKSCINGGGGQSLSRKYYLLNKWKVE